MKLKLGFVQTNPSFGNKEKNVKEAIDLSRNIGGRFDSIS